MCVHGFPRVEASVKRLARRLGVDIRRYDPSATDVGRTVRLMADLRVNLVFDVGANAGQYAHELRRHGYQGAIVSIEPLLSAWTNPQMAAERDSLWHVPDRVAIGSASGSGRINQSRNSVSSSLLPMLDSHSSAAPDSVVIGTEQVEVRTLDEVAAPYVRADTRVFLKVDTQGFEHEVLKGARGLLPAVTAIQVELSLVPLYKGQILYRDLLARLESLGFQLWNLMPEFRDPGTGRLLQTDAVFARTGGASDPAWVKCPQSVNPL